MDANEIVEVQRAPIDLRYVAENCDRTNSGCQWQPYLIFAADLIDSQAKKIEELNDFQNSQCTKLLAEITEVRAEKKALCEGCDIARRDFALSQTADYADRAAMLEKIDTLTAENARLRAEGESFKAFHERFGEIEAKEIVDLSRRLAEAEAQRWIPVEERLPVAEDADKNGNVLILRGTDGSDICAWDDVDDTWEVTHWRPLPEPLKGDSRA